MKTFAVILLAFAVASIECQRDESRDTRRSDMREVIREAAQYINEQTQIDPAERLDLLRKLLKHEIDFDEVVRIIERAPGKSKLAEHDGKYQRRVKEIAEKLKTITKDMPDFKDRMQERYVNREKLNGSL